jgi:hypothetical protein
MDWGCTGVGNLASRTTTVKKLAVSIKKGIKVIITSKKGVRFRSPPSSVSVSTLALLAIILSFVVYRQ